VNHTYEHVGPSQNNISINSSQFYSRSFIFRMFCCHTAKVFNPLMAKGWGKFTPRPIFQLPLPNRLKVSQMLWYMAVLQNSYTYTSLVARTWVKMCYIVKTNWYFRTC